MPAVTRLIKDALQHFHAQGFDFSKYDTDNDGVVDFFYVIWAGAHTGWGTLWWPFQSVFDDWDFTLNGVRFWKYAWMWESNPVGASVRCGDRHSRDRACLGTAGLLRL